MHWAHGAKGSFPDGQLFAELGSHDPAGPPHPGELLGGFLRALGIHYDDVPVRVTEQAALFRSLTAGKRMLLVLDNAARTAQVRRLLPGGTECMVVVTAQSRLSGLTGDGAHIVALEPLPDSQAAALLGAAIGEKRLGEDVAGATDLVRQCGGLPLALTIMAARLVTHPRWPIRRVATELAGEPDRLSRMSTPDGQSVSKTLDLSYRMLSDTAAQCYRALGVHPGRRPGAAVIGAALGLPPRSASQGLEELVEANLADDTPDGRYQMHDLILLHAQRHAQSDPDHGVLAGRVTEWYLAGTRAADQLVTPYRRRPPDRFSFLSPSVVGFSGRNEALGWLESERTNLVAVVVAAAESAPQLAWQIAYGMWPLFQSRRHPHDRLTVDQVGVECARRLNNRDFEARMLRRLAHAQCDLGQWAEADRLFQASLETCQDLDDRHGVAAALEGLGMVALARRRFPQARELFARQFAMCHALGEQRRAATAAINLGVIYNASGQPQQAAQHLAGVGAMLDSLGDHDPYNAARARIELGRALIDLGDHRTAAHELRQALHDMRALGSPRGLAQAHHALAMHAVATSQQDDARTHLGQVLAHYEQLRDSDAAEVRRLVRLIPPADADPHRMARPQASQLSVGE
jgi:tetratricopeptide (TPR) repeat protein